MLNNELYLRFQNLKINMDSIGLSGEQNGVYFCTPIGSQIIGWDNGLHYCFIDGFGEMVFCVNPETCCDYYVYPISENFSDFLSLVLAVNGTNTLQQIITWDEQQYRDFISSPDEIDYAKDDNVITALQAIRRLGVEPMQNPFEYVSHIQKDFDYWNIPFSDEFYDITGIEKMMRGIEYGSYI